VTIAQDPSSSPAPAGPALVVHCKRGSYDVYVGRGRGSRWDNPFVIGRDGDRADVIAKYERWLLTQPELLAAVPELRGRTLGCWCAPHPCHGDVLARLADATG
jgi:Domain of unknown function (DUF4326)